MILVQALFNFFMNSSEIAPLWLLGQNVDSMDTGEMIDLWYTDGRAKNVLQMRREELSINV